jgi:hypothetical protein
LGGREKKIEKITSSKKKNKDMETPYPSLSNRKGV